PDSPVLYTLSLHVALPISQPFGARALGAPVAFGLRGRPLCLGVSCSQEGQHPDRACEQGAGALRAASHDPPPPKPPESSVPVIGDRKSTRLNSSHVKSSYA